MWWKLYPRHGRPRIQGPQLTSLEDIPSPHALLINQVWHSEKNGPLSLPTALEQSLRDFAQEAASPYEKRALKYCPKELTLFETESGEIQA